MDEEKITIQVVGEKVSITIDGNISTLDALNMLMNALDVVIRQSLDEPEKRTKLAGSIGKILEEIFSKEEKMDDKKRTPPGLC